jgi:hypothetical protein
MVVESNESKKADTEEDFTWKYNGEVNIGK